MKSLLRLYGNWIKITEDIMRNTFLKTLIEEAKKNPDIYLITPDLGFGILEPFKEMFPQRFINTGIAEQNAVGVAAGLALNGKLAYVYSIIPFAVARPYEQIKVDCSYMNTRVRIVGVGAGFSYGAAGATHHALEDLAVMRALPNMTVTAPGSLNETEAIVRYSASCPGPMYIRLAKRGEPRFDYPVIVGRCSTVLEGTDFALISTSNMLADAFELAQQYLKEGKKPLLLSAHTLKPFDSAKIKELISRKMPIITLEEHNIIGGLGSAVSEVIAISGAGAAFLPIAVQDQYSHIVGNQQYIKEHLGLGRLKNQIDAFLNKQL